MEKTVFEKIIDREIPAWIIYEDDKNIAFLNAYPFDKGHVLVVPKKAYKEIFEMPLDDFLSLQKIIYKIASKIKKETGKDIVIYQRNGKNAGQEVPHVHFHILPRFVSEKDKKLFNDFNSEMISKEEAENFLNLFKIENEN